MRSKSVADCEPAELIARCWECSLDRLFHLSTGEIYNCVASCDRVDWVVHNDVALETLGREEWANQIKRIGDESQVKEGLSR